MKYITQFLIIAMICFAGEFLNYLLPLPVPGSVYGMVLLFLLLCTGILRLEQIQDTADYLLSLMPLFLVEPGISLITAFDVIGNRALILLAASFLSFVAVVAATGLSAQLVMKYQKAVRKKKEEKNKQE